MFDEVVDALNIGDQEESIEIVIKLLSIVQGQLEIFAENDRTINGVKHSLWLTVLNEVKQARRSIFGITSAAPLK